MKPYTSNVTIHLFSILSFAILPCFANEDLFKETKTLQRDGEFDEAKASIKVTSQDRLKRMLWQMSSWQCILMHWHSWRTHFKAKVSLRRVCLRCKRSSKHPCNIGWISLRLLFCSGLGSFSHGRYKPCWRGNIESTHLTSSSCDSIAILLRLCLCISSILQ